MINEWQSVLNRMTYGIYVLTVSREEAINGMIASWVSQISHEPPLIVAAIHPNRYTHDLIQAAQCFALNVPGRSQSYLLGRFKGPDPVGKFDGMNWRRGITGSPILTDTLGYLECEVIDVVVPGNHTLFIAEVVAAETFRDGTPLTTADYAGTYIGKA